MSFTFNGVNCESVGLCVEEFPPRQIPQRKQTKYSIAGRSGDLIVDQDAYMNVIQPYKVFAKETAKTLQENLKVIAAWLVGVAGYATLTDSYDDSVMRYARASNAVEFINSLNRFGRGTIEFDCMPQRYPVSEERYTMTLDDGCYYADSTMIDAYPLIEVQRLQNGTEANLYIPYTGPSSEHVLINIKNTTGFEIPFLIIDCANRSIYDKETGMRPPNITVTGDWKYTKLGNGVNIRSELVSGNDSSVIVNTRRYWL